MRPCLLWYYSTNETAGECKAVEHRKENVYGRPISLLLKTLYKLEVNSTLHRIEQATMNSAFVSNRGKLGRELTSCAPYTAYRFLLRSPSLLKVHLKPILYP